MVAPLAALWNAAIAKFDALVDAVVVSFGMYHQSVCAFLSFMLVSDMKIQSHDLLSTWSCCEHDPQRTVSQDLRILMHPVKYGLCSTLVMAIRGVLSFIADSEPLVIDM